MVHPWPPSSPVLCGLHVIWVILCSCLPPWPWAILCLCSPPQPLSACHLCWADVCRGLSSVLRTVTCPPSLHPPNFPLSSSLWSSSWSWPPAFQCQLVHPNHCPLLERAPTCPGHRSEPHSTPVCVPGSPAVSRLSGPRALTAALRVFPRCLWAAA